MSALNCPWNRSLSMCAGYTAGCIVVNGSDRISSIWINDHPPVEGTLAPNIGELNLLTSIMLPILSGTIPSEIGRLTQLQSLSMPFDDLSGTLPPEIGQLTKLHALLDETFGTSSISGTIPTQLGQMERLTDFFPWRSESIWPALSGTIPTQVGNNVRLSSLILSNSKLSGTLPVRNSPSCLT